MGRTQSPAWQQGEENAEMQRSQRLMANRDAGEVESAWGDQMHKCPTLPVIQAVGGRRGLDGGPLVVAPPPRMLEGHRRASVGASPSGDQWAEGVRVAVRPG